MTHLPGNHGFRDYGECIRTYDYDQAFMEFLRNRGHTCMTCFGGASGGVLWCKQRSECVMATLADSDSFVRVEKAPPAAKKARAPTKKAPQRKPAKRVKSSPAQPKKRTKKNKAVAVLVRLQGPHKH